jgi:hypothetical protein
MRAKQSWSVETSQRAIVEQDDVRRVTALVTKRGLAATSDENSDDLLIRSGRLDCGEFHADKADARGVRRTESNLKSK